MLILKYLNGTESYQVSYSSISPNIEQITGDFPVKTDGYVLSREGKQDNWDHSGFTTVYREIEGGVQFSSDGSVYVAPPDPEPVTPPEPYVPTLEEVREVKKQEIRSSYQEAKAAGVEVNLSTGTEHFPLTDEDITFLMGKQFELAMDEKEVISYQDSENHCKFYSREDMQAIIQRALRFTNYQTTYRNNLCEWVDRCQTSEEVESIVYGCEIPEQYRNDVYKAYVSGMGTEGE